VGVLADIDEHLTKLRALVSAVAPEEVTGPDAAALVGRGVDLERLGASVRTRFARRVEQTGAYKESGHRSAASWLAEQAGESVGQAQGVLDTARHLRQAPVVDEAFQAGRLSLHQAKVVGEAGAMDASAQEELVTTAHKLSFRELKDRAAQIKRRKAGEASLEMREARAHRNRFVRFWSPPEGGVRIEGWLTTVDGARVKASLESEADRVFQEARAAGTHERRDRYLADALVRVVAGGRDDRPSAQVTLRVDVETLRRGYVEGTEVCEIPGVGPIPVDRAKDLLGDSFVHLLVSEGTDVRSITSGKRTIPTKLRRALSERDKTCAVPGCPNTAHLQIDHEWDFSKGGPTELANCRRLCGPHHKMKTNLGFRLVRTDDGDLVWLSPTARRRARAPDYI
jgi:hypothetical protein